MKNKFLKLLLLFLALFTFVLSANAAIMSEADLYRKSGQLKTLGQYDYMNFVNKHELIGYRANSFSMSASQHKNQVMMVFETFNQIISQCDFIKNSSEFSDSDKQLQLKKLYQDADSALYDLDTKTLTFIFSIRDFMPPVTYDKFVKKFLDFYNGFHFTDREISRK